jgi:hypothetical protein
MMMTSELLPSEFIGRQESYSPASLSARFHLASTSHIASPSIFQAPQIYP